MITASGLEAALECPASAVLPHAYTSSVYAEDGHARHEYLRRVLPPVSMSPVEALEFVPVELRGQCSAIKLSDIVGDLSDNVRSEVAYAYDTKSGDIRELGVGIGRRYLEAFRSTPVGTREDDPSGWIFGTLDVEGQSLDGSWSVKDMKSGFGEVGPAAGNPQLLFFALVLHILHGVPVRGVILRLHSDGFVDEETAHLYDVFDLDGFSNRLEHLVNEVARLRVLDAKGEPLPVNEGAHCRYCPAFTSCPAKHRLARRMLPDLQDIGNRVDTMTSEDAGRAWGVLSRIKPVYEAVTKALKERARREPLPLPGGKEVREISYAKLSIDVGAALALLRAKGATEEELEYLRRPTTVHQVRELKAR